MALTLNKISGTSRRHVDVDIAHGLNLDCKALLVTSLAHVSGAIARVQTFTFTSTSERVSSGTPVRTAAEFVYCVERTALINCHCKTVVYYH